MPKYNEYGQPLNKNGYAPSIMQTELDRCYRCGRTDGKIDFHEVFGGVANREKSKRLGLWVMLCHSSCHQGRHGVHMDANEARYLHELGQKAAMEAYGWTKEDFIREFGKNYL